MSELKYCGDAACEAMAFFSKYPSGFCNGMTTGRYQLHAMQTKYGKRGELLEMLIWVSG